MGIVPRTTDGQISFYESRLAAFAGHADAIGTTPEAVAALEAKLAAARAALLTQHMAQSAARAATLGLAMALDEVRAAGAAIIAQVRTRAQTTDDPAVYQLALLPAPARPAPIGNPGRPERLDATLVGNGTVTLTWTCKNPRGSAGTVYRIDRRAGRAGAFEHLAIAGKKRFVDATIPAGATALEYRIRAIRSTGEGPAATFPVNFGTNGIPAPPAFRPRGASSDEALAA